MNNWYELPAMIPIVIFALAQSIDTYDGIITLVAIFRLLASIYVIRISRSLEDKSRILGGHTTLQVFVIFFLTLNILAVIYDTKQMIKGRIDGLENLSTEDMELLLSLIRTYHESSIKSKTGP